MAGETKQGKKPPLTNSLNKVLTYRASQEIQNHPPAALLAPVAGHIGVPKLFVLKKLGLQQLF